MLISERYNIVTIFHRLWTCKRNYLTNPTRIFENFLIDVDVDTPSIGHYVAAIMGRVKDYTVQPEYTSGLSEVHSRYYVKYVAWALVATCLHTRIKSRMTDLTGRVNPLYKNVAALKYVNFPLFLQLLSKDRIWEYQRRFPMLIPHEKEVLKVVGHWKVFFSDFCS